METEANEALLELHEEKRAVLVVDDDNFLRKATKRLLGKILRDFSMFEASSGQDVLDKLFEDFRTKLALVVSDIQMPDGSGIELAKELRRDENLGSVPIVLMSGDSNYGNPRAEEGKEMQELIERGVVDVFLPKPFSLDGLRGAVCEAVEKVIKRLEEGQKSEES